MLQLLGGTHFLVLRREEGFSGHSISIRRRFDDALKDWHSGDRISPIFPLNEAPVPQLQPGAASWVLFLGPVDPGLLPPDLPPSCFLTLGLFNVVVFSTEEGARGQALTVARGLSKSWEEWTLLGSSISSVNYAPPSLNRRPPSETTSPLTHLAPALLPALREYRAVLGTTVAHAQGTLPVFESELLSYNSILRAQLSTDTDPVVKLGALVTANASLSRFSSQLFAGSSPIAETAGHYWTHSLLGVGIPILAVNNLRRFLEDRLVAARFGDRLAALASEQPLGVPLHRTSSGDAFWNEDPLFREQNTRRLAPQTTPVEHLPLITFLSGRDGFRNTDLSLSGPLEIVSSCNATSWTLHTLTHEISHTLVGLVLSRLLPGPQAAEDLEKAVRLLAEPSPARSLLEQFQAYFCYSFLVHDRSTPQSVPATPAGLSDSIHRHYSKVNEILTHTIDFLYFYGKNESPYVRSVWASWAVIPNIHHRIPDYLLRCLCALSSNNFRKQDPLEITIDRLRVLLTQVATDLPSAQYVQPAIKMLDDRRAHFAERLRECSAFVRFARFILYSPEVAAPLARDELATGSAEAPYNLVSLRFDEKRVRSPLAFADAFASDLQGDELRSAWILHKLAFLADS